ncbi:MAG: hypothetical protein HA496_07985 [Thaumarchaeota archaeon]|nr:hypothetical protein [Nitrososphaerota archaeon]
MNPVLKKRFIDSIEYLRKMGFSEDCARALRISRGFFQPKVLERYKFDGNGLELGLEAGGKYMRVRFECREEGGKYVPDLKMLEAVSIINARIKDTGYQYYSIGPEGKAYIMLSGEDAERLRNERGWDLFTSVYEPARDGHRRKIIRNILGSEKPYSGN